VVMVPATTIASSGRLEEALASNVRASSVSEAKHYKA
jgi:hypothetical protein